MRPYGEEWWWQRLELRWEWVLVQEKLKGRQGMNVMVDYEVLDAFYRAEEGGEMVPWRRNDRGRVEFFNASILGRREEGSAFVSEGKRSMWLREAYNTKYLINEVMVITCLRDPKSSMEFKIRIWIWRFHVSV
jgi:hypothetical protein